MNGTCDDELIDRIQLRGCRFWVLLPIGFEMFDITCRYSEILKWVVNMRDK